MVYGGRQPFQHHPTKAFKSTLTTPQQGQSIASSQAQLKNTVEEATDWWEGGRGGAWSLSDR